MNELVFLAHIFTLIAALLIALRLGLTALVGLICVQVVLMNLFVTKTIGLFGLTVTATDAYAVSMTLGLNVIQEYYGRSVAQKTIWISFFTSLVSIAMGRVHLGYLPHALDTQHQHFQAILEFMPRIVIASLVTYLIVMYTDSWLYALLKRWFNNKYLVIRNYISISVSQFFDTVLFSLLGLYGLVPSIVPIILFSYSIKMIVILLSTPFMALTRFVKRSD
jgi:hypothetical protein